METPEPTPEPQAGGRRRRPRRDRRGRLLVLAVGAVVVLSLLVTAVAQLMSGGAFDDDRATDAVSHPESEGRETDAPFVPEPQRVVPATRLVLDKQHRTKGKGASSLVTRAERIARGLPVGGSQSFTVASFNMLGASHTTGKGARAHFAGGATRASQAASLVASLGLDVVGAQEFEPVQRGTFLARLPHFSVFPGDSLSVIDGTNSIAWDTTQFELVEAETIGIPYFGGHSVRMPYVLLEQRATGQRFWFANFHNPADVHGAAQQWRNTATALEADLASRLHDTGFPVLMTGDFNEHDTFYCRLSAAAPMMNSASGATAGPPCSVPPGPRVDWVLGSTRVAFSDYQELDGGVIDSITDHPVIVADVTAQP